MAPSPMDQYRNKASTASVEKSVGQQELLNLPSRTKNVSSPDLNELSWNLWGAPEMVRSIFSYDAEGDADHAVLSYLAEKTRWDRNTGMSEGVERKWTGWFLPEEHVGRITRAKGAKL